MTAGGPVLRPYQLAAIEGLRDAYARGYRAPILQLATAAGKTVVFSEVVRGARAKGRRTIVVAHRRELVRQASDKLTWAGCPHGIIAAGSDANPDELVQVASISTLVRRLDRLSDVGLIVIDEAHHARASTWREVFAAFPEAKLLGATATPARLDGKGLGIDAGGCFDSIVCGPPIGELVAQGYLAPVRAFVPRRRLNLAGIAVRHGDYVAGELARRVNTATINGDAVAEYRRHCDHAPAIAFCAGVAHAEGVAKTFREAGYRAEAVHGGLNADERDRLIGGLSSGHIEILTSADLISEGLDVPSVGAVIMLRPTKSLTLFLQQCGRGMRPAAGKAALVLLDLAGNCLEHGLPDRERRWSLDGAAKTPGPAPVRICPECFAANPIAAATCVECGYRFERQPRPRRVVIEPDELAEVTRERLEAVCRLPYSTIVAGRYTDSELAAYARSRNYKPGWVWHVRRQQRSPS